MCSLYKGRKREVQSIRGLCVGQSDYPLNGNLKAVVKTNVPYAKFVEYGTIRQKAQPYMRPSFRVQKAKFIRDIKNAIGVKKKGG